MHVVKRDGQTVDFNEEKIFTAICKAMLEVGPVDTTLAEKIAHQIGNSVNDVTSIENIQDLVEQALMYECPDVAKKYILYREKRAEERVKGWNMDDLQFDIWNNKYRFQGESFDEWVERVSGGDKRIAKRIRKKQFLFGGRILYGRGLHKHGIKVTYSNCYVLPSPLDSIEGIWDTARDMARTYSYSGGCGISLRHLRPRDAIVHNSAKTTSGAVSFMDLYSLTTGLIGQNGRRGALMLSIPSKHPDLAEFIDVKRDLTRVTKANISVEWSDDFLIAVEDKKPYTLSFTVEDTGEVIEKEVDAYSLFRRAAENNWLMAEPGCLFWDRISSYHLMSADPTFEFAGTNPCAEEPLPAGGSCLLGSINLSEFVIAPFTKQARFDFPSFVECVHDAVWALNDVLDEGLSLHPLEIQKQTVEALRQIGLGVMGIHEMLIKLGMVYGSTQSMAFCEVIAHLMLVEAVRASSLIAKERGSFSRYDFETLNNSWFFQSLIPTDVKELVKQNGLRNSQLLCIAPTGSISTMLGISGGMEPIFALGFNRTTETLHKEATTYFVHVPIITEYLKHHPSAMIDGNELFVTAHDLDWKNRIEMQAVWQKYVDASISSTINLHEDTSVEEIVELYLYAWKMGLKGCTIYRNNCARTGILTLGEEDDEPTGTSNDVVRPVSASMGGSYSGVPREDESHGRDDESRVTGYFSKCPTCGSETHYSNGCVTCPNCGFSPCG